MKRHTLKKKEDRNKEHLSKLTLELFLNMIAMNMEK